MSLASSRPLLIIDGYEQLSWLSRQCCALRCRRASAGCSSRRTARPACRCSFARSPTLELAEQLVSTLTAQNPSRITAADVAASHACHGSNLRELLFALYDRHEATCRRRTNGRANQRERACVTIEAKDFVTSRGCEYAVTASRQ